VPTNSSPHSGVFRERIVSGRWFLFFYGQSNGTVTITESITVVHSLLSTNLTESKAAAESKVFVPCGIAILFSFL
jgi:hypothetical protein